MLKWSRTRNELLEEEDIFYIWDYHMRYLLTAVAVGCCPVNSNKYCTKNCEKIEEFMKLDAHYDTTRWHSRLLGFAFFLIDIMTITFGM